MEALDSNGKQISQGTIVKYVRTHTTGKVDNLKSENGAIWVKIDTSGLYYKSKYIEVVESKNTHKDRNKPQRERNNQKKFNIEIPVVISDTTDGPGVGGG